MICAEEKIILQEGKKVWETRLPSWMHFWIPSQFLGCLLEYHNLLIPSYNLIKKTNIEFFNKNMHRIESWYSYLSEKAISLV